MIKRIFLPFALLLFLFAGCMDQTEPEMTDFATGIIEAEFLDAENQEPVTDQDFNLSLVAEGTDQPVPIGIFTSDDDGMIEAEIVGEEELTVVQAIIEYVDENEELQTIEEDTSLELRFEEPFETVNFTFEI